MKHRFVAIGIFPQGTSSNDRKYLTAPASSVHLGKDHRGGKAMPLWRAGGITTRLVSYLESRPRSTVAVILTLVVALVLVVAGLALGLWNFGKSPYPNQKLPVKMDHDGVLYTQPVTFMIQNGTAVPPYSWMKILFRVAYYGTSVAMPVQDFGNSSLLKGTGSSSEQVLMNSTWTVATINITENNEDGSFDEGDTILFELAPLRSDMIFTIGLVWPDHVAGGAVTEFSFAVHHGKLYSWYSNYLGDKWYWPYLTE
jgi:hypothetical protein